MPFARSAYMSTVRSTVWGIVVVLALIFIAILAYGSCHSQP
jgi:hypothetical protein